MHNLNDKLDKQNQDILEKSNKIKNLEEETIDLKNKLHAFEMGDSSMQDLLNELKSELAVSN